MARPTKEEQIVIAKRDGELIKMSGKYPVEYLATYFGLTESRVSQILKRHKEASKVDEENGQERNEVPVDS